MLKNKRREQLRARTTARSKAGGGAAAPTRSEKDRVEVARAKCRDLTPFAVGVLEKGAKGKATSVQVRAAESILDRGGIPKVTQIESQTASQALTAIAMSLSAEWPADDDPEPR